jgi:xylulose-5-phosphate/fructose-6-phosphate phosphoketolase
MVMLNNLDRLHLVMDFIARAPTLGSQAALLRQHMFDAGLSAHRYTHEHGEDDPTITTWTWPNRKQMCVPTVSAADPDQPKPARRHRA